MGRHASSPDRPATVRHQELVGPRVIPADGHGADDAAHRRRLPAWADRGRPGARVVTVAVGAAILTGSIVGNAALRTSPATGTAEDAAPRPAPDPSPARSPLASAVPDGAGPDGSTVAPDLPPLFSAPFGASAPGIGLAVVDGAMAGIAVLGLAPSSPPPWHRRRSATAPRASGHHPGRRPPRACR